MSVVTTRKSVVATPELPPWLLPSTLGDPGASENGPLASRGAMLARAEESADMVVTPTLGRITMLDFGKSSEIIECGRRAAQANMPAIMAGYERLKVRHVAAKTN